MCEKGGGGRGERWSYKDKMMRRTTEGRQNVASTFLQKMIKDSVSF